MVQQVASVKTETAAIPLPFNFGQSAFSGSSDSYSTFSSELLRQTQQQSNEPSRQVQNNATDRVAKPNSNSTTSNESRNSSYNSQQDYHNKQAQLREDMQKRQNRSQNDEQRRDVDTEKTESEQTKNASNKNNNSNLQDTDNNQTSNDNYYSRENSQTKSQETDQVKSTDSGDSSDQLNGNGVKAKDETTNADNESASNTSDTAVENSDNQTPQENIQAVDNSGSENESVFDAEDPSIAELELRDNSLVFKMPGQIDTQGNTDDFDYVSFVTQIAQIKTSDAEAIESKLSAKVEASSLNDEQLNSLKEETDTTLIQLNLNDEFSSISIDKSALQKILDFKDIEIDPSAQLSSEELADLKQIISDMLQQMPQQTENQSEDLVKLDEALLMDLLLNDSSAKQDIDSSEAEKMTDTDELISALTTNTDKTVTEDLASGVIGDLSSELPSETATIASLQLQQKNDTKKTESQKFDPSISSIDNKSDANLAALALLNEEHTQKAVENIASRLQTVLSELNEPNKTNEFIAALQSNVKEFKQLLNQGVEASKDLKSLISDALVSSGIEVSSTKQIKIDGAVNQFNAVLNLANNINYSANQQQAQVLGITDLQYARELNQQQIDGTKLASATNQASMQANADKAVNILKQEGQAQLAEKVKWMVNSRNQSAEIRLDPPDLGGINIRVNMSGDSAQVNFNVQSNAAKEALDQALPRLREMLQDSGIELGQSNVQQESQQQQGQPEQEKASTGSLASSNNNNDSRLTSADEPETQAGFVEQRVVNGVLGGVDYYA